MKKPIPILVGLVLAVGIGALTISLVSTRPEVSMTVVEYKRWPHGAMLRLTNGTQTTIRYLAERNGTPAGSPILCVQKTSNVWTTVSVAVGTAGTFQDPITGKSMEAFYLLNLAAPPKPGDPLESLVTRDLKPGQTVEFFVRIEPGAAPKRVGTICCFPQSKLTRKLQAWLFRFKQWCGIKTTLPGQVEVWCPKSLYFSSSQQPAAGL